MTITLAAGSYTWTSGVLTPDPLKSTTIICATVRGCTVSLGTSQLLLNDDINGATSEASQKTWKLDGFDFSGACTTACIWAYPRASQPIQYLTIAITNNTFGGQQDGGDFALFGEGSRPMRTIGVIGDNIWNYSIQTRLVIYGTANPSDWSSSLLGNSKCIFFERNTVNFTAPTNGGSGWVDSEASACTVFRNNTITNARTLVHGVTHGWGSSNFEVYRNTYVTNTNSDGLGNNCYRRIHNQGSGTGMYFDNVFTCGAGLSGDAIALLHYRDATCDAGNNYGCNGTFDICDGTAVFDGNTAPTTTHRGYPCKNQPGRTYATGAPAWGTLAPIAYFNNRTSGGTRVPMSYDGCGFSGSPVYCTQHVVADRDYYDAVGTVQVSASSPFNGTTGTGFGTLVRRPTTCTHTTAPDGDNGGGVMYWASDAGEWDSTNGATADGQLYRCSATDTWTLSYIPYTYPHPLTSGASGSSDAPASNLNRARFLRRGLDALRVIQQILHQPTLLLSAIF